jgi:hypothetical protein
MRAEIDWATAVGIGRIQDKTRWTKALGETVIFVYGDCTEKISQRRSNTESVFDPFFEDQRFSFSYDLVTARNVPGEVESRDRRSRSEKVERSKAGEAFSTAINGPARMAF